MMRFKDFTLYTLDKKFNLQQVRNNKVLEKWLAVSVDISETEHLILSTLREILIEHVYDWNETELAFHFIGPIFSMVNFNSKYFNAFAERKLNGSVNEIELSGRPDGMIASGKRKPEIPYFCFQAYKKETDANGDPAAQVLAAMLVAQTLNKNKIPIYGCYVRGRNWFFLVLQNKKYCISENYSATKKEIFDIFSILKTLKQTIITIVKNKENYEL